MRKKIEYDEFISRAKKIWGDRFIYKEPKKFNFRKDNIEIFCPVEGHGWFSKLPSNHITDNKHRNPSGCPNCFLEADRKAKMKPFSDFLIDARKVHGDKYEYVEETYDGAKQNLKIICPKHGHFLQSPDGHINNKSGCDKCADDETSIRNKAIGLKNAQKKLAEITSNKVQIIDESYVEQREEADFVCEDHGEFRRIVILALTSVYPCKECGEGKANTNSLSKDEIRHKILAKKGNFEILEILDEGRDADVRVVCLDCDRGEYITSVGNSYNSEILCGNCRRIASEPYRKEMARKSYSDTLQERTEEWLQRFYKKWGDRYDYSEVGFEGANKHIKVICNKPHHPPWFPAAHMHLTQGCPACANEEKQGKYTEKYFDRFPDKKNKYGQLYYLKLEYQNITFFKVGITINNIKTRHHMLNSIDKLNWSVIGIKETTIYNAFLAEQEIQKFHGDKYRQEIPIDKELVRKVRLGPSECFFRELPRSMAIKYFKKTDQEK